MGWLSKPFKFLRKVDSVVNPLGGLGIGEVLFKHGDVGWTNPAATSLDKMGFLDKTPAGKQKVKEEAIKAESETAASARAAVLTQERAGMQGQAEMLAKLRARKGFLSTILSGGSAGSALSDLTAARKQLLGQ